MKAQQAHLFSSDNFSGDLPTFTLESCSVIDLFCGVGGMTHGFVSEGFNVVAGLDSDKTCKYAYERNNNAEFIHARIEDISHDEIRSRFPDGHTRILVGCAPCQPFSPYTKKKKSKDDKWTLVEKFADVIESVMPDIVSMENVPELRSFKNGKVYNQFIRRLEKNYFVTPQIVSCPNYGIPQSRKRLVVLASRFGYIEMMKPTHTPDQYKSVEKTIGHLEPLEAGQVSANDPLHRTRGMTPLNLERIKQSRPGGTWKDWDQELIANCHRKATGESYFNVYGRMQWGLPSPTITGQFFSYGSGRFGHPEQNRALSLREGALLQTFPANYEFVEPGEVIYFDRVGTHIGNAVPVDLGRIIARSIANHLGL